ncbi:transcriptional regulator ModE [Klebsiella pneumoniae]|uniref:Transcriptional regulator ModE n=1 Tax=Klebsiella pneumoniae TaxID=573 RepID=A0A378BIJ1_KLEPN|nr:transcriptional regulator ModE [Klebsiella pneumoniae]
MLVLLKAPWVGITLDPAAARQADNQLSGRISHIECGSGQCEVLMTLADGQTLCATLPQAQAAAWRKERRRSLTSMPIASFSRRYADPLTLRA